MIEGRRAERSTYGRRAGQPGHPSTPTSDLLACPPLGVASEQKVTPPLLVAWSGAGPRVAACGKWDGARGMVRSDDERRRHYASHRQARIQPRPRRAVSLQPQPRLRLSDDALRRDSHSSERFVGHPPLAVGGVRNPARGDRARGALSGTHLRRGVPGLQEESAPLGVASGVFEKNSLLGALVNAKKA